MLRMVVPAGEYFDDSTGTFFYTKETTLVLEHSLAAIARWESKWKKRFLDTGGVFKDERVQKTPEEFFDYIRCMAVEEPEDKLCFRSLTPLQLNVITAYINDPATATTFTDHESKKFSSQQISAEIVYFWMTQLNIPFECENWNFNRLLALIRVCSVKNQKPKKRPMHDVVNERKRINAERQAKFNTRG